MCRGADNYDCDGICQYDQIPFKNIFKDELEKQSITIGRVRQVISQKEELFKKFKIDDKFITKVRDSVRYIMKVNNKIEPRSETDAAGFAEPVTHRSSDISDSADKLSDRVELVGDRKRSYYLPADLKLIHEHLALFINTKEPLIKSEFESYVLGKPELQELVSKYGLEKLRIKVRTERKSS